MKFRASNGAERTFLSDPSDGMFSCQSPLRECIATTYPKNVKKLGTQNKQEKFNKNK